MQNLFLRPDCDVPMPLTYQFRRDRLPRATIRSARLIRHGSIPDREHATANCLPDDKTSPDP